MPEMHGIDGKSKFSEFRVNSQNQQMSLFTEIFVTKVD